MTPEHWQKVFALVKASQQHPEDEQASFIAESQEDPEILKAAQSLLHAQHRMGTFLEEAAGAGGFTSGNALTANGTHPGAETSHALVRGAMLGRYVVLNLLGMGGMGVVYAAYDPELGRKLAIKLLHPETSRALLGSDGKARLLREAQAMARLAHPNVISVHDVGTFGDEVFIAMEYVDGDTLKAWLEAKPRRWLEIVAMFVQAGFGLSAAHSAGIVHRDFKPENVLVGKDGRARVLDFGLARGTLAERGPDSFLATVERQSRASIGAKSIAATMTLPGTLLGTPAYMAPEQLAGGNVDARTDQFGFCASLFQALHGELPFVGETLQERLISIQAGDVTQPKTSNVPGWLHQAVLKGLQADPENRYDSMEVLLLRLQHPPSSAFRRVGAFAALGLLVVLAPWVTYRLIIYRQSLACRGAEEKLAGVWDSKRTSAVHRAFIATLDPNAPGLFESVKQALDRHAHAWVEMRIQTCGARLRGEEPEALIDLRMTCLQNRLDEMRRLTERLTQPDVQSLEKSVELAQGLTPIGVCEDAASLAAQPTDPPPSATTTAVQGAAIPTATVQPIEPLTEDATRSDPPRLLRPARSGVPKKKSAPRRPAYKRRIEID